MKDQERIEAIKARGIRGGIQSSIDVNWLLAELERLRERVERLETGLELIEASGGVGFDVGAIARAALAPPQAEEGSS